MTTLKVEIELNTGTLTELGLALTQHVGELKHNGGIIGQVGLNIGSGEYRGNVKYGNKEIYFSARCLQPIMDALTKQLEE